MPRRCGERSVSEVSTNGELNSSPPVLEVERLRKHFPIKKGLLSRVSGHVYAVDGVSFSIGGGETLGLVGESGCGKSTVGRTVLRLIEPTAGIVKVDGTDITTLDKQALRTYRRRDKILKFECSFHGNADFAAHNLTTLAPYPQAVFTGRQRC